jgi:CheY-like chemotaxis protein
MAGTVVLVDPDRRVRTALRRLVAAAGFDVVTDGRPDVAIVEPLVDGGYELIATLAAQGTAVLALSLREQAEQPSRAAGAVAFLTKTCTPEELLEHLARISAPTHVI